MGFNSGLKGLIVHIQSVFSNLCSEVSETYLLFIYDSLCNQHNNYQPNCSVNRVRYFHSYVFSCLAMDGYTYRQLYPTEIVPILCAKKLIKISIRIFIKTLLIVYSVSEFNIYIYIYSAFP